MLSPTPTHSIVQFIFVTFIVTSALCYTIPRRNVRNSRQICPIPNRWTDSDSNGTTASSSDNILKVIDLSKTEGKKVRIQFYTPNPARAIEEESLDQTTLAFPYFVDDTSGAVVPAAVPLRVVPVVISTDEKTETTTWNTEEPTATDTTTKSTTKVHEDIGEIMCQWEFQAANESEYLLLTFNNLSAPYSTDCSEAYVALQKDNGYESRWCGNRRQQELFKIFNGLVIFPWRYVRSTNTTELRDSNSRPMSLFSKTSAKITVFRRGDSPSFPPTGFSVTVESLDIFAISGIENSLRVLLG